MSKKPKYKHACNVCSEEFKTKEELIKHHRKDHPEHSINLYNAFGTTGDPYADTLVAHLTNNNSRRDLEINDLRTKYAALEADYKKLQNKFEVAVKAIQVVELTLENAHTAVSNL
jgi:hypothetical protein